MGLLARINVSDWGFPDSTPTLHIPIDYVGVGDIFQTTAVEGAKGVCPVDTGYLQSSISGSGGNATGEVEATAEYAQYVEYGTWKMAAQPYFTNAVISAAQLAFQMAMNAYNAALQEEQEQLAAADATAFSGLALFDAPTFDKSVSTSQSYGAQYGASTAETGITTNVNGIEFRQDGSVLAGSAGYYKTNPDMWRPGTTNYEVALHNQAHLDEYRTEAMNRFAAGRAMTAAGAAVSPRPVIHSNSGGVSHFAFWAGTYAMSSAMLGGSSLIGGLGIGLLVGGLGLLLGSALSDAFGGGSGPQFSPPEIIIT